MFVAPPLNLAYVASAIRDSAEVSIIDCYALEMGMEECAKKVVKGRPDIVAVIPNDYCDYVIKGFDKWASAFFSRIKNQCSALTVAGGPHAMALPEETLRYADVIIRGDQDAAFRSIADAIKGSKAMTNADGIGFTKNKKRHIRKPLYAKDIDSITFPSRGLLHTGIYKHVLVPKPMTTVKTSRGCPYNCIYCTRGVYGPYRERSPDNVIEELRGIREKSVIIYDDIFTFNRKRTLEICDKIIRENMDIMWACSTRTDAVDRKLLERMRRAGCFLIAYGVESGDQRILNNLRKGISAKETESVMKMTRRAGIKSVAYMLLGSPGETAESVGKSIAMLEKARPDYVQFNPITVYPGSDMYKNNGNRIQERTLKRTESMLYRKYYIRPGYILRQAAGMRSLHDMRSAINGLRFIMS